jgi:thiol-disulfide isomerase/thioredoxin
LSRLALAAPAPRRTGGDAGSGGISVTISAARFPLAKRPARDEGAPRFMKRTMCLLGVALIGLAGFNSLAAKLGDAAAPLKIKEWIKGSAVDVKDGKNFYVVEFWATWCGPCRVSIPHLTELQKKLKDKGVVFIGISDESADKVKPFVEQQGEKMDYRVALDDDRGTSRGYMEAFAQNGIPHAFVVSKDGKVIWQGHPMSGLDKVLEQVVAGKYDVQTAIQREELRANLNDYLPLARSGDAKAKELGKKILEQSDKNVDALCDLAFAVVTDTENQQRDFALADSALIRAEKAAGKKTASVLGVQAIARFESGKREEGLTLLKEAVSLAPDDQEKARYQNWLRFMERRKESLEKKDGAEGQK